MYRANIYNRRTARQNHYMPVNAEVVVANLMSLPQPKYVLDVRGGVREH